MLSQKERDLIVHGIYVALDEMQLGIMFSVDIALNNYQIIINGNTYHTRKDRDELIDKIIQGLINTYDLYCVDYEKNGKLGFSIFMEIKDTINLVTFLRMKGI